MKRKFEYRASIREVTLPEMLSTVHRFRVAGTIEATQGSVVKKIVLQDGQVVHAGSNDLGDSLGEYLKRLGKLTKEDYQRVADALVSGRKRFGVLLIELGILTPREVYEAIQAHIEEIVWSLFNWRDGEIIFNVGEPSAPQRVRIQLPLRRVIFEGIRQAPEAKPLVERLGRRSTIFESSFQWEDLIEIGLDSNAYRLLTAIDGKKSLYDLCSLEPLSAAENAKLIYAFQVLHLVRRRSSEDRLVAPQQVPARREQ
ncbi:MAG: DUF4388 domain-containing protein [Acidobacteria bacterium]|nr:DUF4388 domain-containing protein [Acidobacteriota bacterium]